MNNPLTFSQLPVSQVQHAARVQPTHKETSNAFVSIPSSQRQFIRFCVVAYILFIIFASALSGKLESKILLLVSSVGLISAASIPLVFKFKDSGFLHPLVMTSALALANMAIKNSGTLANGLDFHVGLLGHSKNSLADLVAYVNLLGIIAFLSKYAGYAIFGRARLPLFKFSKRPNSLFLPLLFLWLLVGVACLAYVVKSSGGVAYQLKNIHLGAQHRQFSGSTSLHGAFSFIIQSCVIIPALYGLFIKKGHKNFVFFGLIFLSFIMVYLNSGRRSSILIPTYLGLAVWIYKERKLPIVRIFALILLLFFFLAAGRVFRRANQNKSSTQVNLNFLKGYSLSDLAEISLEELTERGGSANALYPIIAMVPKRVKYNYFQSYFENAYRFIPRSVWPEKPDGIGIVCSEVFFNRFNAGGIPPGPMGEAYWSLGIFGVIVVYFSFGMLLRLFGNMYQGNSMSTGMVVLFLFTVVRLGPDQISFRVWVFTVVPLILFAFATNLISLKGR